MPWTVAKDVTDAWIGDDKPDDDALITVWIDKAERHIRSKVRGITERLAANEPDLEANVIDVVVAMVQRVFRNPEGVRTRQTSTGPYSDSVTMGGDQPGTLWITDDELASISGSVSKRRKALTVSTIPAGHR